LKNNFNQVLLEKTKLENLLKEKQNELDEETQKRIELRKSHEENERLQKELNQVKKEKDELQKNRMKEQMEAAQLRQELGRVILVEDSLDEERKKREVLTRESMNQTNESKMQIAQLNSIINQLRLELQEARKTENPLSFGTVNHSEDYLEDDSFDIAVKSSRQSTHAFLISQMPNQSTSTLNVTSTPLLSTSDTVYQDEISVDKIYYFPDDYDTTDNMDIDKNSFSLN